MVKIIGGLLHKRRLKKIRGRQMVIEINKAIHVAADIIASDAAHSITEGAVSGRHHVPSKPGEPPNADTHKLDRSIAVSVTSPMKAEINVFAPYAAALEFGTSKVAERPFMRPATEKNRKKAERLLKEAVKRVVKGETL